MEEKIEKNIGKKKIIVLVCIIIVIVAIILTATVILNSRRQEENCIDNSPNASSDASNNPNEIQARKPVIYLYPEREAEVVVRLGNSKNLTHTYPKYETEWRVIANPNGELIDTKSGRNLYCLYWEGISNTEKTMQEGFIVKGVDTISFLEEKLELLGLNERESNEFIIYWLPKLESNKYNYIRFQTLEEIDRNMPLDVNPTPDTVIRVMMEYRELEDVMKIEEQKLQPKKREGFTVVEWGGAEV